MTLKEKAQLGRQAAMMMKSAANTLEYDMRDYDCSWPKGIIRTLRQNAEDILKNYK